MPLLDFALASLIMSLGIGADVAIATALRANQLRSSRSIALWVVGVSVTHTVFPMLGYLLTYFSIQVLPGITPIVGLIAFSCIFFYLKSEWETLDDQSTQEELSRLMVTFGLILAVSWDALWSGPAKSAQVIGWPEAMVWVSFIIVGMLVSLLAITSLWFAKKASKQAKRNKHFTNFGQWVQYSVIGYFGLLALFRYTLGLEVHWIALLTISLSFTGLMLLLKEPFSDNKNRLMR